MSEPPAVPTAELPGSLLLAGAGKMGLAMLEGWLALGLDPRCVTVLDPAPSRRVLELGRDHGMAVNPSGPRGRAEVAVLAIKPQMLDEASPGLRPWVGRDTLAMSVLAGKTVGDLRRAFPEADAIVRAMPNLPAAIGRGATGLYANAAVTPAQRRQAQALLSGVGLVEWIEDEALIDAVTAVSGSGPAYLFLLAECLAEAGVAAGLDRGAADRLARATVIGAAALLDETGEEPATLRQNVTSPGGTTAAALEVLMAEAGLRPLLAAAVLAAKRRAGELSG